MAYSLDFRKKVFQVKEKQRLTFQQTSDLFDISMKTLFNWQDNIEPCLTRDKPATKINMDKLAKDIEERPDDYQWERAKRFGVTQSAIKYALDRLKVTYKKNSSASKSKRKRTYVIQKEN